MTRTITVDSNGPDVVENFFQSYEDSIETINPGTAAAKAARIILCGLHHTISENQFTLLRESNVESLHNFRIAVRKTRTLLSELDGVLPEPGLSYYRTGFAEVMSHTGRLRDLEVLIKSLPHLENDTVPVSNPAWSTLLSDLRGKEQEERHQLLGFFNSDYYTNLMNDWSSYLDSVEPGNNTLPQADMNIRVLATKVIRSRHDKLIKLARKVIRKPSMHRIHALRKSGKRLRYLLDLFESIYPETTRKRILKELKRFQDVLGEIQDIEVQIGLIGEASNNNADPENENYSLIMKSLLNDLSKKKKKLKLNAVKLIDKFPSFSRKKLDTLLSA